MTRNRPYVLSIAGFDPSAGAGILADIKTFEANEVYGLGVCSALTFQNDREFEDVQWVKEEDILKQIEVLLKRFEIRVVKLGLIKNFETLTIIISNLKSKIQNLKLIWDPILKASAGFNFHVCRDFYEFELISSKVFLITPNLPEMEIIFGNKDYEGNASQLSYQCAVLLKGGHDKSEIVRDILFHKGKKAAFESPRIANGSKHGSGCVLSSAIAANLAKGHEIKEACRLAKEYVNRFLASSETLLGYHHA